MVVAGSVSSATFKYRAGGSAGETITLNGQAGAGIFGGMLNSFFDVSEIMA